jgi:hypothetical protein
MPPLDFPVRTDCTYALGEPALGFVWIILDAGLAPLGLLALAMVVVAPGLLARMLPSGIPLGRITGTDKKEAPWLEPLSSR